MQGENFVIGIINSLKMKFINFNRIDRKLEKEIKAKIFVEWPELDLDSTYNQIAETLDPKYRDLLSVFTLDSDEQAFDIDIAILTSLLKG